MNRFGLKSFKLVFVVMLGVHFSTGLGHAQQPLHERSKNIIRESKRKKISKPRVIKVSPPIEGPLVIRPPSLAAWCGCENRR